MKKKEITSMMRRRQELINIFNTEFRPCITGEGKNLWVELQDLYEKLRISGK